MLQVRVMVANSYASQPPPIAAPMWKTAVAVSERAVHRLRIAQFAERDFDPRARRDAHTPRP